MTLSMPIQIWDYLCKLLVGYGTDLKKTKNFTVVWIEKEQSACKIFNPKRFDGSYPLCKRKYAKKLNEDNIQVEEYIGFAKVVDSLYTPIRFRYVEKGKLTANCFIQRYDEHNILGIKPFRR